MSLLDDLRRRWWIVALVLLVLVALLSRRVATFYTEILWFSSVGFTEVFTTALATRIGLGLVGGLVAGALVVGNLLLARRVAPSFRIPSPAEEGIERYREAIDPLARPLLIGGGAVVGLFSGLAVTGEWQRVLLWANAVPFGQVDPQFGLDLSFFVFRLPFYEFVNAWLFTAVTLATVLTVGAHYLFGGIRPQSPGQKVSSEAVVHLSVLLAGLVAVRAWGFWLDRYLLSFSTRGRVTGLSYTDATAQLQAFTLLTIIASVCVVLFLANLRIRSFLLPTAGVGILVVAAIVLSGVYPAVIQRVQVEPQELEREREFIERNLEFTRFGFNLEVDENLTFEQFPANDDVDAAAIADNRATIDAIRLWDPAVLGSVYTQLQGLRRYFRFDDIDVDRYQIDGEQTQVNIAVRELDQGQLPDDTWQNRHLVYTHGFGFVASDVSAQTPTGEPDFLARNIPPAGIPELDVDRPEIYFGERGPEYSVVGADADELDYTLGEEGAPETQGQGFRYDGADGVGIGTLLRRAAFALRYAEPNLLLSSLLNDDSRVLFNRQIGDRVEQVAPYLQFDGDAYPAVVDGRVKWIVDAYTTSDMLPYSERVNLGPLTLTEQVVSVQVIGQDGQVTTTERLQRVPGLQGEANYIRNSVKAVVDAYDGTVTLYVVDPDDPVIAAWQQIFPSSLTPFDEASEELTRHFRYPEDLFRVQTDVFTQYHVTDASTFYFGQDRWSIPTDAAGVQNLPDNAPDEDREIPLRPYYLQIRLPGEDTEEFALIQPFNPLNRPNLIAWMAARSDPGNYGELRTYLMPGTENVTGTEQTQALINQDQLLRPQITLADQRGSRVIYGNLLIIPIEESLLYAQPLYVRSDQGQIPELQFVVLVFGQQVAAAPTLDEALEQLFGEGGLADTPGQTTLSPGGDETDGDGVVPAEVVDLITQALQAFQDADEALREGDLAGYQESTQEAEELLRDAQTASGGTAEDAPSLELDPDVQEEVDQLEGAAADG